MTEWRNGNKNQTLFKVDGDGGGRECSGGGQRAGKEGEVAPNQKPESIQVFENVANVNKQVFSLFGQSLNQI